MEDNFSREVVGSEWFQDDSRALHLVCTLCLLLLHQLHLRSTGIKSQRLGIPTLEEIVSYPPVVGRSLENSKEDQSYKSCTARFDQARGSSQTGDQTHVSCIAGGFFTTESTGMSVNLWACSYTPCQTGMAAPSPGCSFGDSDDTGQVLGTDLSI